MYCGLWQTAIRRTDLGESNIFPRQSIPFLS
jgi:hypothetical protein